MTDWVLLGLIAALVVLLLLTVFGFVVYSGLFTEVVVSAGSPPVGTMTLAYKFRVGPYGESGQLFTDGCSISSKLCSIGVYYDNPHTVSPEKCRFAIGRILSEGDAKPSEEQIKRFQKYGFKIFTFPAPSHVVMATFPFTTPLSIHLAVNRVHPALDTYIKVVLGMDHLAYSFSENQAETCLIFLFGDFSCLANEANKPDREKAGNEKPPLDIPVAEEQVLKRVVAQEKAIQERKLCAHPRIEIYKQDRIYFVCPLARQGDFYVPEMKELERKSRAAADEAEDAQTDITGVDTMSEASSISMEATTDSRDTSVATSILLPFPASRGREEPDNRSEHSYSESGASGSSFEELDLEVTGDGEGAPGLLPDVGYAGNQEVSDKWTKEPIAAERGEE
ncbi:testis expressed 264 [Pitangus sulphuratus]|nr:testis expressed 264 [Pitangus sulphuratus]